MKDAPLFPNEIETDRVPVFKSGIYPQLVSDSNPLGMADARLLGDVASSYDIQNYASPITVDHLQHDQRFGTVGSVKVVDGKLFAKFRNVVDEFAKDLKQGKWLYPSIELYDPQHSGNPTPGKWYLKAVTFLGAAAPQVKGLYAGFSEPFIFTDGDGAIVCLSEFNRQQESKTMTEQEIQKIVSDAVTANATALTAQFEEKFNGLKAENDSLKQKIADKETSDEAANKAARIEAVAQFCERMKKEGRYTPAFSDGEIKTTLTGLIDQPTALQATMKAYEAGSEKGKHFKEQTFVNEIGEAKLNFDQSNMIRQFSELSATEKVDNTDVLVLGEHKFNEMVKAGNPATYDTRRKAYSLAAREIGGAR